MAFSSACLSQELRRIKPVPKLACHSVASWCHPRAPNLDILTCVKDSHIWYAHFLYSRRRQIFIRLKGNFNERAIDQPWSMILGVRQ